MKPDCYFCNECFNGFLFNAKTHDIFGDRSDKIMKMKDQCNGNLTSMYSRESLLDIIGGRIAFIDYTFTKDLDGARAIQLEGRRSELESLKLALEIQ